MAAAPPPPIIPATAVRNRSGVCRVCFEGGGELIQPCLCKGTSKWIHRDCLNHWRAVGNNPRALTNCCECGFQYHLTLQRVYSDDYSERRRRLLIRMASQGCLAFFAVQLMIVVLGCLIRAIDSTEQLVEFFHFPQDEGQASLGTFIHALQFHKTTYYVSGLIALLALIGVGTSVFLCTLSCCGRGGGRAENAHPPARFRMMRRECDACDVCIISHDCCRICCECGYTCGDCRCCGPGISCPDLNGHGDNPLVVMLIIVVFAFVVIGLFTAIVAFVVACQRALQQYAQLQHVKLLAEEYVVDDLADPQDLGDTGTDQQDMASTEHFTPPPVDAEAQRTVQEQITKDIDSIFNGSPQPSAPPLHQVGDRKAGGYGSTA